MLALGLVVNIAHCKVQCEIGWGLGRCFTMRTLDFAVAKSGKCTGCLLDSSTDSKQFTYRQGVQMTCSHIYLTVIS